MRHGCGCARGKCRDEPPFVERSQGHQSRHNAQLGKNFVLGICVSLMALTFDMAIMSWSEKKKRALGL